MGMNKEVLVRTLYGEAAVKPKNQSEEEELKELTAIAWTVVNRARLAQKYIQRTTLKRHPLYGNGEMWSACLAPAQYSCWDGGDYTRKIAEQESDIAYLLGRESNPVVQAWDRCHRVAARVLAGLDPDPTGGATHYHAASMTKLPHWAPSFRFLLKIGDHLFYASTDPI